MVRPNAFRAAIMTEMRTTRTRYNLRAISILASALALVGFGTFAYSAQSSAAAIDRLYQVIAELTANQMQLIAQRDEVAGYLDAAREALALVGGRLESRPGGGTLSYEGAVSKANLGTMGSLAFDALRSLRFSHMVIRLDGDLAGEFAAGLTIDQVGLANATGTQRLVKSILGKIPFKFNVSIRGPFRALIAMAKSFRDPRNVIDEVMPVPINDVPGIVTEVRRREEEQTQTQTPVEQDIDVSTKPPSETKPSESEPSQ